MERMFPRKVFGTLKKDDYDRNGTWGVMCREEGIRITNELHRLTIPSERNVPYNEIATWSNGQVKEEILTDEMMYIGLQQDLAHEMLAYIESHTGDALNETKQFFMPPGIFDGIISIMMQELKQKAIRPYLCDPTGRKALLR